MKAALLSKHGGVDAFYYGDTPDPVPGPGEIVVDIHAASVNAADYKVRLGSYDSKLKFPYILGRDFSGVVSAVGPGADLRVGDEVFAVCDAGIEGAYAEKIAIKSALAAIKPPKLNHDEAAAMALTSLTAIWAIEDTAQLKKGETVLIDMKSKAASEWSGNIYSRDSGNTYYATMALQGPDQLQVEACALGRFFCSGNAWSRIAKPERLITYRQISTEPRS